MKIVQRRKNQALMHKYHVIGTKRYLIKISFRIFTSGKRKSLESHPPYRY